MGDPDHSRIRDRIRRRSIRGAPAGPIASLRALVATRSGSPRAARRAIARHTTDGHSTTIVAFVMISGSRVAPELEPAASSFFSVSSPSTTSPKIE